MKSGELAGFGRCSQSVRELSFAVALIFWQKYNNSILSGILYAVDTMQVLKIIWKECYTVYVNTIPLYCTKAASFCMNQEKKKNFFMEWTH